MKFLAKLWEFNKAVGFSITIASIALAFTTWRVNPEHTVASFWMAILGFISFVVVMILLMVMYGLFKENAKLEERLALRDQEYIPRVRGFREKPRLILTTSRSPLFADKAGVSIFLRGEINKDSETFLCYGQVLHLFLSVQLMEVIIDDRAMDAQGRNWLLGIFNNHNNHAQLYIYPGKITEKAYD